MKSPVRTLARSLDIAARIVGLGALRGLREPGLTPFMMLAWIARVGAMRSQRGGFEQAFPDPEVVSSRGNVLHSGMLKCPDPIAHPVRCAHVEVRR
ncbi:MAG: hypothetical protein R3B48_22785 [Kofleriaceae bacterium]